MYGEQMLPIRVHETWTNPFTHGKYAWASNVDLKLILIHIFVEVVINYQKGEIESPSLVLDNWWNLVGLIFASKCVIRLDGPIQVVEQVEVHGDGDGHMMIMIML